MRTTIMKNKVLSNWLVPLALGVLVLSGCKHDPLVEPVIPPACPECGTLRLHVVPEWEGAPLTLFSEYTNVTDYRTTVELLKMYFSEIRLMSSSGSVPVTDVALFNLDGPRQAEWSVPVGTYDSFHTGLGVPEYLNHTDPAIYPVDHPLGINSGTNWTWNSGYRFVMFEGRYDADPQSTDPLTDSYSIHTGLDTCYSLLDLSPSTPISITRNGITELTIHVAVDRFFYSATDTVDLSFENTSHGNDLPLALKLTRNMVASITVD